MNDSRLRIFGQLLYDLNGVVFFLFCFGGGGGGGAVYAHAITPQ